MLSFEKYINRFLYAVVISLAAGFTLCVFGPFEIVATNHNDFNYTALQILPALTILCIVLCLIVSFLVAFFKGTIFNIFIILGFAASVAFYIQGNFINSYMGALTGDFPDWSLATTDMTINFLVWELIFLICFLINTEKAGKKRGKIIMLFTSVSIVVMQLTALVSLLITESNTLFDKNNQVNILSEEGMYEFSKNNNTIVFVLDRLDYDYIELVLEKDPSFFDELIGFTSYTNAISENSNTWPALNRMLTSASNAYRLPEKEFLDKSWNYQETNILEALHKADYDVSLYTDSSYLFGNEVYSEIVSNNKLVTPTINYSIAIRKLIKVSIYRHAPVYFKRFFQMYSGEISRDTLIFDDSSKYNIDEVIFSEGIDSIELIDKNVFKMYHFFGSHAPYTLKEDGSRANDGENTDVVAQTMGCFNILYKTFDKMKELGIYDNSNIIIVADHGAIESDYADIAKETRIGLFYKPSNSYPATLKYSSAEISNTNIMSTIFKIADLDYSEYLPAIEDITESDEITRYYYRRVIDPNTDIHYLYHYEIHGDASNLDNWNFIKTEQILYPH